MEEELKEKLRDQITESLNLLKKEKPGSEEHERLSKEIVSLTQALDRLNQSEQEAWDKQERREADAKKNQQLYELEVSKSKIDWKRWGLDVLKVMIPGCIGWLFYSYNQNKLLKYEEEGRVTSDTGRQGTRLPNPFNFFKNR